MHAVAGAADWLRLHDLSRGRPTNGSSPTAKDSAASLMTAIAATAFPFRWASRTVEQAGAVQSRRI